MKGNPKSIFEPPVSAYQVSPSVFWVPYFLPSPVLPGRATSARFSMANLPELPLAAKRKRQAWDSHVSSSTLAT